MTFWVNGEYGRSLRSGLKRGGLYGKNKDMVLGAEPIFTRCDAKIASVKSNGRVEGKSDSDLYLVNPGCIGILTSILTF